MITDYNVVTIVLLGYCMYQSLYADRVIRSNQIKYIQASGPDYGVCLKHICPISSQSQSYIDSNQVLMYHNWPPHRHTPTCHRPWARTASGPRPEWPLLPCKRRDIIHCLGEVRRESGKRTSEQNHRKWGRIENEGRPVAKKRAIHAWSGKSIRATEIQWTRTTISGLYCH